MLLTHKREIINIDNFRKRLFGKSDCQRMLIPIYKDHNGKIEHLIGNGYALRKLERFKISLKHLEEFLVWKYKINPLGAIKLFDF